LESLNSIFSRKKLDFKRVQKVKCGNESDTNMIYACPSVLARSDLREHYFYD